MSIINKKIMIVWVSHLENPINENRENYKIIFEYVF